MRWLERFRSSLEKVGVVLCCKVEMWDRLVCRFSWIAYVLNSVGCIKMRGGFIVVSIV